MILGVILGLVSDCPSPRPSAATASPSASSPAPQAKLDVLADELTDAGIEAAGFPADVMDPASVAAAFDRITERFGEVDVLEYSAAAHNHVPGLSNPTLLEADRLSIQPQIDYYLYGGLAAT
ncbi:hypothetical protein A6F55_21075 [Prescottella equi]|uniref:SDR family oxidoreductase n=1 Tax=Rhodococcus hoagii TaxID=43767 RepID=UPI000A120F51|nr:SDR family oxidoreductase [Prescottella equi]ORJ97463.1 hypothetical protein A6F55_21075 [Prescottella equi]